MERNEEYGQKKSGKQHNVLSFYGNEATMNLNSLILTNIQGSSYFKVQLFKLKTYHEVVDEIYYQVKHLEPWERGSRKTAGQTGMCGGVRGVGAGGIVSTAFCLLYKLYTLKLTRKQVNGLMAHTDSPFIRALGFMYVRYTQPPGDLFDWYEEYLQDEEEIDIKAGGGQTITIGQLVYQLLTKLDWFSTLFPRIPVPMQKQIESKLANYCREYNYTFSAPVDTNARERRDVNNRDVINRDRDINNRPQRDDFRNNDRNERNNDRRNRSRSKDRDQRRRDDRDRNERRPDRWERPDRSERNDRYDRGGDRRRDEGRSYSREADRERDRGERERYREKEYRDARPARDWERERDRRNR